MEQTIKETCKILQDGGIILYPTDTVWGIGCDATNEKAIRKIFSLKQRSASKGMILLADSVEMLKTYVQYLPQGLIEKISNFNQPTTIIYPGAQNLPDVCISEDGTIALRITKDPFCSGLIALFGKPIVSTSANISNNPTPKRYSEIDMRIIDFVDFVVPLKKNELMDTPSTILKWSPSGFEVIRK